MSPTLQFQVCYANHHRLPTLSNQSSSHDLFIQNQLQDNILSDLFAELNNLRLREGTTIYHLFICMAREEDLGDLFELLNSLRIRESEVISQIEEIIRVHQPINQAAPEVHHLIKTGTP